MDDEIRQSMISFFMYGLGCAFKRDVINSTKGICLAISDPYSDFNKEEILSSYLSALNESKYKDYAPLRDVFEENIAKTDLLVDVIEACRQKGIYLQLFGIVPPTSTAAQETSSEGVSK